MLPLGPDTYTISVNGIAQGFGGVVKEKQEALTRAQAYCRDKGRELIVISTHESDEVSIDFRCLRPGDPELVRPQLRQVPNVLIEDGRR